MNTDDLEKLTHLFEQWGAGRAQAGIMAAQTLKRAGQISEEQGVSQIEALEYLLKVAAAGREGKVYDGPKPGDSGPVKNA